MGKPLKSKILKLFAEGKTYNEISKTLRCSKGTISFHCSKFIENKFSEDKVKEYQDYYNLGFNLKQTALHFKVAPKSLSKRLKLRKLNRLQIIQKANLRKTSYRNEVKKKCVEYKGGKCLICEYNRCYAALDFHHKNPEDKDFTISGGTKSFENLKPELDKCILVCRNCHSEIHSGLINLTNYF